MAHTDHLLEEEKKVTLRWTVVPFDRLLVLWLGDGNDSKKPALFAPTGFVLETWPILM